MDSLTLLSVAGLTVEIKAKSGSVQVVRNASLDVKSGSWLGLVGESGAGKSILGLSILRLLPPGGTITSGTLAYRGRDLLKLSEAEMEKMRGQEISVVFQNALTALNPLFRAGAQVADVYRFHQRASAKEAQEKVVAMFGALGLSDPEGTTRMYPYQLSGGMAQRVMLAMALICSPRLLIADDPTSTLDPTIEAQVLDVLADQVSRRKMSMLFISRDIRLVSALCAEMAVMRAGEIVESGPVGEIVAKPTHPYTMQLLADAGIKMQEPFHGA
jgi:peptide/nickel transport system ATP-binding protein/oligopeptide transport system ATP-binding protein